MSEAVVLRTAREPDWVSVAGLLTSVGLPLDGAQTHLMDFVLAYRGEQLVGCAGLERYRAAGLLRSVAVAVQERGGGVGQALVESVLAHARAGGLKQVVLLTETAREYFPRFGFRIIPRAEAPETIKASEEFTTACPESATVMALQLA